MKAETRAGRISWTEARGGERQVAFAPDPAARARIAAELGLEGLEELRVAFVLGPWRDGVEVEGELHALAGRLCDLTLEPFEETVASRFRRRLVRQGSPNLPGEGAEVVVDPEGEDPPEAFEGAFIDLAGIAAEELLLALDPFPRKPGAAFEAPAAEPPASPFAALAKLRLDKG
ncbi:MAG TPA: DUF177 domain-containing protein [Caulobacteraceae bacterium]|nr:DUF177 domain-containing protein [Caulobacteraceae bacterium]